jgi:hypothetical protein
MTVAELVYQHLRSLPESVQVQVLDYVEFLEARARGGKDGQEDAEWSALSLSQAMRGLEDEASAYSTKDLKETFS